MNYISETIKKFDREFNEYSEYYHDEIKAFLQSKLEGLKDKIRAELPEEKKITVIDCDCRIIKKPPFCRHAVGHNDCLSDINNILDNI